MCNNFFGAIYIIQDNPPKTSNVISEEPLCSDNYTEYYDPENIRRCCKDLNSNDLCDIDEPKNTTRMCSFFVGENIVTKYECNSKSDCINLFGAMSNDYPGIEISIIDCS